MKCIVFAGVLCLVYAVLPASAGTCPTQFDPSSFTKGDFFRNFNNKCYFIDFATGHGADSQWGDLDTEYSKIFYRIDTTLPPYELVIIGNFPNARYFSIDINDDHSAISQSLTDVNILPLTPRFSNPFLPGVSYVANQTYAVPIKLGGTPGNIEPGCVTTGYNLDANTMDGTLRHPFMNWNLDAAFFKANPTMPLHAVDTPGHTNPNLSGAILVRNYLD